MLAVKEWGGAGQGGEEDEEDEDGLSDVSGFSQVTADMLRDLDEEEEEEGGWRRRGAAAAHGEIEVRCLASEVCACMRRRGAAWEDKHPI